MTAEDKMTIDERRKYLQMMKPRYKKATRKERGQLLDEMETVTGLHRKSLVRLMKGDLRRKPRRKQRGKKYDVQVTEVLRVIASSLDYPCAERLTPNLEWMAKHLASHGELEMTEQMLLLLRQISISTVERRLAVIRQGQPRVRRRRSRPVNSILRNVPMGRIPWNVNEAGHFETDLVHHCGQSASGEYVHTLQMVDVASGWAERRAILGRSYLVMEDAFSVLLELIPFVVLEIHPDNGSEFFNHHLLRFWEDKVQGIRLSRSRPYHKNDNPFIEQRNADPVRAYLGYDRLDTVAQTRAVNQLYDKMRLYHNLFQPVMRVQEKVVVSEPGQPTRIQRHYDDARTPFDRLCDLGALSPESCVQLATLREQTNPRQLLAEIQEQIDHIFSLPGAAPGETQDVYQTLVIYDRKENGE